MRNTLTKLLTVATLMLAWSHSCLAAEFMVSGGGSALQDAISGATDGDEIIVTDSAAYNSVVLTVAVDVIADVGQKPRVIANSDGVALVVADAGRSATWSGIDVLQSFGGGAPGHNVLFVANNADDGTLFTMTDCSIGVDAPGDSVDARVAFIGDTALFQNCCFFRTDDNGNPLAWVGDAGGGTTFEGCSFGPKPEASSILLTYNNSLDGGPVTFRDCTWSEIDDFALRSADQPDHVINVENCHIAGSSIFAGAGGSAPGTVFNVRECVLGPTKSDRWLVFSGDAGGMELNFTNCAFVADGQRGTLMQDGINAFANDYAFTHCSFVDVSVGSTSLWLDSGNNTGSSYSFDNCINSSSAALVDEGLLGAGTVVGGTNMWQGTAPANDAVALNSTSALVGDLLLQANDFHLLVGSDAIDAGPDLVSTDIDGEARTSSDLGCDEFSEPTPAPIVLSPPACGISNVVIVSGGANALQDAINNANPGESIQVSDSALYDAITIDSIVTIRAQAGQTPVIQAAGDGVAVRVASSGTSSGLSGFELVQTSGGGTPGHGVVSVETGTGTFRLSGCTISIQAGGSVDGVVVDAQGAVELRTCTLSRSDASTNALVTLGAGSTGSSISGCSFGPGAGTGVRVGHVGTDELTIADSTFSGLGGFAIVNADSADHALEILRCTIEGPSINVGDATSAAGSVWTVSRSVLGPTATAIDASGGSGAVLSLTNCAVLGKMICGGQSHTVTLVHDTFVVDSSPALDNFAGIVDAFNSIFSSPLTTNFAAVTGTATVGAGANLLDVATVDGGDVIGNAPGSLLGAPDFLPDGFRLGENSDAEDAAAPDLAVEDIDGQTRPFGLGFDLGCYEFARGFETLVNGGGNALQVAIDAAGENDEIVVTDSEEYTAIRLGTKLTIRAADGESPSVVHRDDGNALLVFDGGRNATWSGIDVVKAHASGGFAVFVANNADDGTLFTIENCDISKDVPGNGEFTQPLPDQSNDGSDGPAMGIGDSALVRNCHIFRNDDWPHKMIEIFDNGAGTTFEGCDIGPGMDHEGITWTGGTDDGDTLTIRDTIIHDLTSPTYTNPRHHFAIVNTDRPFHIIDLDNVTLENPSKGIFVGNRAGSAGMELNVSNSLFKTPLVAQTVFSGDGSGAFLSFVNTVFQADSTIDIVMFDGSNSVSNDYSFIHCTFVDTEPVESRTWLWAENAVESTYDFRNCIFSSPQTETLRVIGSYDPGTDVIVSAGTNLWDASPGSLSEDLDPMRDTDFTFGTNIDAPSGLEPDGIHVGDGAAIDAGVAIPGITTDIDGEARAQGAAPDLGADECGACDSIISVGPVFRRGDHDGSGLVDITDPLNLLGFLFLGTTPPICQDASDGDNSAALDISDALNILGFLFLGSFPLNETLPGPSNCGLDPDVVVDPDGPGGFPEQPALSLGCDLYPSAVGAACP